MRRTSVRRGDRTSDRGEPASRLMSPGSAFGRARAAKRRRDGRKRQRRPCRHCAGGSRRANPHGSKWPARAGTAPREGKALEGSSRDASGMEQGREASGATAIGGVQKTSSEPRAAGTVERGKNPEDGTDEGLAILVPRGRPQGSPRRRRGTRRRQCPREQEPHERRTRVVLDRSGSFLKGPGR